MVRPSAMTRVGVRFNATACGALSPPLARAQLQICNFAIATLSALTAACVSSALALEAEHAARSDRF